MYASEIYAQNEISIYVNNDLIQSEIKPIIIDGYTYVPVRVVSEAMGCVVEWMEESKTVNIAAPNCIVAMQIGNKRMSKQYRGKKSETIESNNFPIIIEGSTFLPLRTVSEAIDCQVEWDAETKSVFITSDFVGESNIKYRMDGDTIYIRGHGAIESSLWHEDENYTKVKYCVVEEGITSIGEEAFALLKECESIKIPNSVSYIGDYAFRYNKVTELEIPNGVVYLGKQVFNECNYLKKISLSSTVKDVTAETFYYAPQLEEIQVSADNTNLSSLDGVLYNKDKTQIIFYPPNNRKTTYEIPNTVVEIKEGDFGYLPPDKPYFSLEQKNLECLKIPASVEEIDVLALPAVNKFEVDVNNNKFSSVDGVLFTDSWSKNDVLLAYPRKRAGKYIVPENVRHIHISAFSCCINLTEVTLPSMLYDLFYDYKGDEFSLENGFMDSEDERPFRDNINLRRINSDGFTYKDYDGILYINYVDNITNERDIRLVTIPPAYEGDIVILPECTHIYGHPYFNIYGDLPVYKCSVGFYYSSSHGALGTFLDYNGREYTVDDAASYEDMLESGLI